MYENGIVVVYDEKGSPGHGVVTLPGWAAGDPQMAVALYLHGHRSYADTVAVVDWSPVEDVPWASDDVSPTGAVKVSPVVAGCLAGVVDELAEGAKRDPLAAIEEAIALLGMLASGSWGEGTRTATTEAGAR